MLKTLIKKQLLELFQTYFIDRKTGKVRSKSATILFILLFAALFVGLGFVFYTMAGGLGTVLFENGLNWLYFALMGLLAMALGVFGSVFNTYASVYLPKDNEFLMSLPLSNKTLLFARLFGVYITSLMYSAWIWIPAMIAYWVLVPIHALNILFPLLMTFIIALFVSVLSCILGWVVALIVSKAKGKSFLTLFLSLAVFALYYFVYFKIVGSLNEIFDHLNEIGETVKSWLHYFYLLGKGSNGDVLSMLLIIVITFALAVGCFFVLSQTFTKLSTTSVNGNKKTGTPMSYAKKAVRKALILREFKHFSSVSTWMLNGGFGLLLLPIAAVAMLIKCTDIQEILPEIATEIPQLFGILPILFIVAVCLILSTSAILPVSVSMEGNTLWQIQSLPLDPWDILRSKENMGIQLCLYPSLFFALVGGMVLKFRWWETVLICFAIVLFIGILSDFGLFLNLKMPNFSWSDVASLTKQSAPVVISMFGGWAFCAVLGIGSFFLTRICDSWLILCGMVLLFAALWLALHQWLKSKGTAILASL